MARDGRSDDAGDGGLLRRGRPLGAGLLSRHRAGLLRRRLERPAAASRERLRLDDPARAAPRDFPWVYSSRLGDIGPGARWASSASQPALEGLHVVASLLEPATNLRQDARQVAAIYRHFATHTAPLVAALPSFQPGRAEAGRLYRRGRFLLAHQGSLHVAGLDGPRGRLAASAYNYILRRFACFFAVRRAALRALIALPSDVQRIAESSTDPCLRQHVEEVARAG